MKDTTRLRHLAVSLLLTESALAVALPQQIATTAAPAPLPWVTVNPSGSATTITPQVITTEGHISTVSQAPGELLSTVTYTFSSTDNGGGTSTYTGLAPVAQPTDITEPGGVFLACHSDKGNDAPFCLPRSGTTLVAGKSYYITWDTTYFPSPQPQNITIQASYPPSGFGGTSGWTTSPIPANQGFYIWTVSPDLFPSSSGALPVNISLKASFSLTDDDDNGSEQNDFVEISGPSVWVVLSDPSDPEEKGTDRPTEKGTNIIAIIIPIVIVALLIGLGTFCFLSRRKNGKWPIIGKRTGGYGTRQSRSERVGGPPGAVAGAGARDLGPYVGDNKSETNIGVELTDRDSWSPTARAAGGGGRNVFREEVERQERAARGERR